MNPIEKQKTIVFAAPKDYELHHLIQKNLEFHGFKVTKILSNPSGIKYKNWKEKMFSFFKKNFFNDKNYKKNTIQRNVLNYQIKQLSTVNNYDYGLFIRADFFDNKIINLVRLKVNHLVSYHYDGLKRSPDIFQKIKLFDNFFVFEKEDLITPLRQLSPCTNFYFDFDLDFKNNQRPVIDFYFLGSHHDSRLNDLLFFSEMCIKKGYSASLQIVLIRKNAPKKKLYINNNFTCLDKTFCFEDYIENIKKTKVIIDFVIDEHSGLSFRVFESIKYQKKIITTNPTIVNYDFYNPNNIFVVSDNNYENIENFINSDYIPLPSEISEKYSFKNWINYILNIKPYQTITIS